MALLYVRRRRLLLHAVGLLLIINIYNMSREPTTKQENYIEETPRAAEVIEKGKLRISVRNLVEFVFRSGDIDNRVGKGGRSEAMLEGSRMHRMIQRRMGSNYRAEVTLRHEIIMGHYVLLLEGRADGIFFRDIREIPGDTDGAEVTAVSAAGETGTVRVLFIDEIKSMYTDVTRFEEPIPVHLAQAKCYAYIFAVQNGLDRMGVQITYCNLDTEKMKQFEEIYSFAELSGWFEDMIASYRKWTDDRWEWNLIRRDSIMMTEFPFPYREGQRELAADVYRTIAREKILFLQAPTGTGKTIATVFPAVKAVGQGLADRIFYLTAKTITRTVAKEAFDLLKSDGLQMRVLTLTAKEKLCPCDTMDCNPVNCPYAKGHYDRVGDAVFELMTTASDYTRDVLLAQAERYRVCPFEMALDLALWSDAVICDYNYIFDPNVYLRRFFEEGERGDYVFLVDEAHNLVERGREMYSARLVKEDFLKFKKIFKNYDRKIVSALESCNRQMLGWKRECEGYTVHESVGNFAFSLMRLMSLMDEFMRKRPEFPERREVTEFYFAVRHFMNMFDRMDEHYVLYSDFDEEGRFLLHLYCVNPAKNLQECIDRGRSAVFFSATLLPINYYKNLLSTRDDNYAVYAETSFKKEQRLLFVAGDVSSLYKRRSASEYEKIASYIAACARARKGNYIAYFPSYKFMEDVYEAFLALVDEAPDGISAADCISAVDGIQATDGIGETNGQAISDGGEGPGVDCIMQAPGMREEEREEFIEEFSRPRERSLVAFCVVGGIFAEGIDLPHERLIGVLVVGTGLPQICNEREVLKRYYNGELYETEDQDGLPARSGTGMPVRSGAGVTAQSGAGMPREGTAASPGESREGFSYAYQYPGMNKVMQAAGRVIRTATDVGVIGLLDERFLRRDYRELFPREWDDYRTCRLETLPKMLEDFWARL